MEQGMITLVDEDGTEIIWYILEQTELAGETYLLVTNSADESEEEAEALILREVVTDEEGEEAFYETVEDDATLRALSGIFEELLEDVTFTVE